MSVQALPIEVQPWETRDSSEHPAGNRQWIYRFGNGYGASVVQGQYTYGGDRGLYELGVIRFEPGSDEWYLTYETPITENVLGHLSLAGVAEIMVRIAALDVAS